MTNETRKTLVLLKAQLAACEEAARRFAALKDTLQQSASGGAMTESTAEAERSLAAVRSAESSSSRAQTLSIIS